MRIDWVRSMEIEISSELIYRLYNVYLHVTKVYIYNAGLSVMMADQGTQE